MFAEMNAAFYGTDSVNPVRMMAPNPLQAQLQRQNAYCVSVYWENTMNQTRQLICYWLGINLTNYLVNFNFCHVIMPSGNHTRYTRIHIHHNSHWYEKWAHCREDDIALILIISAFIVLFSPSMIIPEKFSTFSFRLRLSQILWILWQHHDYGQMLSLSPSNRKYTHQPKIGGQVMANANVQTITIINNASRLERRLLE